MDNKIIKYSTASLYVVLYVIVATISCICSIDFFDMTHNSISSIILSISFEIGSMGCLFGAITTLKNKNNTLIWVMFIFLTLMQMMNNTYYAYAHIENYTDWVELFDLVDLEPITQKRIISVISGCVLPLVSLSFVHLLVDLLKNDDSKDIQNIEEKPIDDNIENDNIVENDDEDDVDEDYEFEFPEVDYSKENVYEAELLTEDQNADYDKKYKKRGNMDIAKEEMKNALQKLDEYKKMLEDGNS